jgi:glycosyltransferase involved in cell wall biosynthesis
VFVHEPSFASVVRGARVVPHGIETPERADRASARAELGVADDRLCALCFGFLSPYKGLEVALDAARIAGDGIELVVAGGEHPRERDDYAADLRASAPGNARFTGFVPDGDVATWFAAADVLLLLYPQPFAASGPLALALAHGTPVLMSASLARTTGAPQALVTPLEPAPLAERLRCLAADAGLRARLREAAAHLAEGRTWPEVARTHLDVYGGAA